MVRAGRPDEDRRRKSRPEEAAELFEEVPRGDRGSEILAPRVRGSVPSTLGGFLLDLDLRALLLEGRLDLLGLVAGDRFLDRLGCGVDEVLGFLEPQPGELADDLDDGDLVRADLREDGGELRLLLLDRRGSGSGRRGGCDRDRRGSSDAELLLEFL